MSIKALRQRLHDLKAEGRQTVEKLNKLTALDAPGDSQRDEIAALDKRADEIKAEIEQAQADLDQAERQLERERAFQSTFEIPDNARITDNGPDPAQTFGFGNLAEFALAVRNASPGASNFQIDERLSRFAAPSNFHRETGSTDGYQVPPQYRAEVWDVVNADDPANLLNLVDAEPTVSNAVEMLADESTPWGASGVQAYWRSEGSQMSPSRLSQQSRTVKLGELYAFVLATEELLEDAPRLNARLTNKSGLAIRWKASDAIMWGDGVGKPLGYMNSAALVSVAEETTQIADTIVAGNVAKMYARMLAAGMPRAIWLVNSDVLPQLMTMTLGNQPIWTPPSTGFANAPGGMLFGRPVVPTEHCKTLGDKGDIQLIDPMGYYAARKQAGVQFASSMHLYFDYNIQAFRWTFRLGGQPYLSAPVSPAEGSATKSHFIVLDERAG